MTLGKLGGGSSLDRLRKKLAPFHSVISHPRTLWANRCIDRLIQKLSVGQAYSSFRSLRRRAEAGVRRLLRSLQAIAPALSIQILQRRFALPFLPEKRLLHCSDFSARDSGSVYPHTSKKRSFRTGPTILACLPSISRGPAGGIPAPGAHDVDHTCSSQPRSRKKAEWLPWGWA